MGSLDLDEGACQGSSALTKMLDEGAYILTTVLDEELGLQLGSDKRAQLGALSWQRCSSRRLDLDEGA